MLAPDHLPVTDAGHPDAADLIGRRLAEHGLALLTGLSTRPETLRTARAIMCLRTHRDSDADAATVIEQRIAYAATASLAGFTDRELHPHTEGTAVAEPPRLLFLACIRPADVGGTTVLVDAAAVYADIAATDPDMLDALSTPRSAFFGGPAGHLGAVFTPHGRHIRVRLRFDDMIRFAPAAALYRDGLWALVRRHEITVSLAAGDGYVLLNDRWLHGRTRYTGPRQMLRLLGEPHPHLDIPSGFPVPSIVGTVR
jgi:hypothetical protein